jgi:hypothetical protein
MAPSSERRKDAVAGPRLCRTGLIAGRYRIVVADVGDLALVRAEDDIPDIVEKGNRRG